jgi:hypothetical protein
MKNWREMKMIQTNKIEENKVQGSEHLAINRLVDLHLNFHGRLTYTCKSSFDLEIHINKHGL